MEGNIYSMTDAQRKERGIRNLQEHLSAAIDALEQDSYMCEVLGEQLVKSYISAKRAEWKEYCTSVSEWEVRKYLDRF